MDRKTYYEKFFESFEPSKVGQAIYSKLCEKVDISKIKFGFIAGQAVSSAFFELFGQPRDQSRVVYNDVDVFFTKNEYRAVYDKSAMSFSNGVVSLPVCSNVSDGVYDAYSGVIKIDRREHQLVSSRKQGMLNTIIYDSQRLDSLSFLSTFDFNCVQIGYDIQTNRLLFTSDFVSFCKTNQLIICCYKTPAHTLIRYFHKKKQLGCYGDDEFVKSSCAYLIRHRDDLGTMAGLDGQLHVDSFSFEFGEQNYKKYLEVEDDLADCFEVSSRKFRAVTKTGLEQNIVMYHLNVQKNVCLMPQFETGHLVLLNNLKKLSSNCVEYRRDKFSILKFSHLIRDLGNEFKTADIQRKRILYENSLIYDLWEANGFVKDYLVSGISPFKIALYNDMLCSHDVFCWFSGLNFSNQLKLAQAIKSIVNRRGLSVYGYLENANASDLNRIRNSILQGDCGWIDAIENDLKVPFSLKNLISSIELDGYVINQLSSCFELNEEGSRLKHCVGGYAEQVRSDTSRIFSVSSRASPNNKAFQYTVELRQHPRFNNKYQLVQAKGFCNRSVSEVEFNVAKKIFFISNMLPYIGWTACVLLMKSRYWNSFVKLFDEVIATNYKWSIRLMRWKFGIFYIFKQLRANPKNVYHLNKLFSVIGQDSLKFGVQLRQEMNDYDDIPF